MRHKSRELVQAPTPFRLRPTAWIAFAAVLAIVAVHALWTRVDTRSAGASHSAEPAARLPRDSALLVLWTDVRGGGPLWVTVDARPVGVLTQYFSAGLPRCASGPGVLAIPLSAGPHLLSAHDEARRRWHRRLTLPPATCVTLRLTGVITPSQDTPPFVDRTLP